MATDEEDNSNSAAVPLLLRTSHPGDDIGPISVQVEDADYAAGHQTLGTPGPKESGTWFIWALTFSSGISGLLFGYEYCHFLFFLRCPCFKFGFSVVEEHRVALMRI